MNDRNTKMNWTIILYRGDDGSVEAKQMMCPNCAHRLLEYNMDNGVLVNKPEAEYLLGGSVPVVKFKCPWCKSDFTLITQG